MDPETSPFSDLQRSASPIAPLVGLIYSIFFHGPTEYFRKRFYDDDELWCKYETEGMPVSGTKLKPVASENGENAESLYTIVQYQVDSFQQSRRLSVSRKEGGGVGEKGNEVGKRGKKKEAEVVIYYTKIRNSVEDDFRRDASRVSSAVPEAPESNNSNQAFNTNGISDDQVDLIVLPLYPNSAILRSVVISRPEKRSARCVDQFFSFTYYNGYSWLVGLIRTIGCNAIVASLGVFGTSKNSENIIPVMVVLILFEFIASNFLFARRWRNNHLRAVLYSAITTTHSATDTDETEWEDNLVVDDGDGAKGPSHASAPAGTHVVVEHQNETYENFVGEDIPNILQFLLNDIPNQLFTMATDLFFLALWLFFLLPFLLTFGPAMYIVRHTAASKWRLKYLKQYARTMPIEGRCVTEITGTIRKKNGKFIYLSYEYDQMMYDKRIDIYEMFNGGCLLDSSETVGRPTRLLVLPSNPTSAILTSIVEQREELEILYNSHHWPFAKAAVILQIVIFFVFAIFLFGRNLQNNTLIFMAVFMGLQVAMGYLGAAMQHYLFFSHRLRYGAEPLLGKVRDRVREPEMSREVTNMAVPLIVTVPPISM